MKVETFFVENGQGEIYLNFLPFVVNVLQPRKEKAAVISWPYIFLVHKIFFFGFFGKMRRIVNFLVF